MDQLIYRLAAVKVYFFAGWQYVGLVTSIATFTVLINQYREKGAVMPGIEVLYAVALMAFIICCTVVVGAVLFHTVTKRENNITVKNTPLLYENLQQIEARLSNIESKL